MAIDIIVARPGSRPPDEPEMQLLRAALARRPNHRPLLAKLAQLLVKLDRFDDAIALLDLKSLAADTGLSLMLAHALLVRALPDDAANALTATQVAVDAAQDRHQLAAALAERGKCHSRLGHHQAARLDWQQALELDPGQHAAFKRLVAVEMAQGDASTVLALCDALQARNVSHSRLWAMRCRALAMLGRPDEARHILDLAQDINDVTPPPPPGWPDTATFNQAVTDEVFSHPDLRGDRHGTSSIASRRVDHPNSGNRPAIGALLGLIIGEVKRYLADRTDLVRPWLVAPPPTAIIDCQAVITGADGYEQWHMHDRGWISGGYYPCVPPDIAERRDMAGCLDLGLPPPLVGQSVADAFGSRRVRPRAGLLALFPSHANHRTFPHGCTDQRICIAFDVRPV